MRIRIVLTLSLVFFLGLTDVQAEKIKLATGEWSPYTSADMPNYGYFTALVTEVLKEMGQEPEYLFYPWRRCFDSVKKGKVWAAFPYTYTKERAKEVLFSDELSDTTTKLFFYDKSRKGRKFKYESLEDLKAYKIGGVKGYFYEERFREAGIDVEYSPKEINAMEKLKLGRLDLVPLSKLVGWHLIKTSFPEDFNNFGTLEKPLSRDTLRLIVSWKYPDSQILLEQFNSAFKRCREKGGCQDRIKHLEKDHK